MATPSSVTRIDSDVFESARHFGATMSRSAAQQVTHWARIGRELEAGSSASPRDITRVLAGQESYDRLTAEQQAVVRANWSELLEDRIGGLNLAKEFAEHGRAYTELDASGQVVKRTS